MSLAGSISNGLQAALLLATGRREGLLLVAPEREAAIRSFWAIAVCFPAFVCMRLLAWRESGMPADPAHAFAADLLAYVIGWIGYAVLSREVARALGRERAWPRYLAVWNWCNVAQYVLLVAASVPALLGAPLWVDQVLQLVAVGWALWLEWFAARLALTLAPLAAAGLVALDLALGLFLAAASGSLAGGG
ncbi:MAG: hypothetical protein JOZ42_16530 [Acetobacteraceae bacterium]|nr:hypothetical protein [Acetobacteraceae bacterium]